MLCPGRRQPAAPHRRRHRQVRALQRRSSVGDSLPPAPGGPLSLCNPHLCCSMAFPCPIPQASLKEYAGGAAAGAAGLKPVELRFTSVLPAFQTLRCSVDLDLTAPVPSVRPVLCDPRAVAQTSSGLMKFENASRGDSSTFKEPAPCITRRLSSKGQQTISSELESDTLCCIPAGQRRAVQPLQLARAAGVGAPRGRLCAV